MTNVNFSNHQKIAIVFSCLILVTGLMGIDFINPSLPYIMKDLSSTQYTTKYLIVVYLIAVGISQFFYGTFSDNYGRRKAILLALIIAIIGTVLSASSTSMTMLFISRFITGLGAGGTPVIARAIIADVCHEQKSLKKAFSYFSISSQVSPAFAPVIGAALQELFNWESAFIGLGIITLISFCILLKAFKETHELPLNIKKYKEQLLTYAGLFKLKRFIAFSFASAFVFVVTISYYSYMPFILHAHGYSPIENGVIYSFYAASIVAGSFALAKKLHSIDSVLLFKLCVAIYLIASIIFFFVFQATHAFYFILAITIIMAFTCGIAAPLILSLCLQGFTSNKGAASAVQGFIKMFFTGIALMFFNFIPMYRMESLMICFVTLSCLILGCYYIGKSSE